MRFHGDILDRLSGDSYPCATMATKRWSDERDVPGGRAEGWCMLPLSIPEAVTNTACKHGVGECELCGTTGRRDQRHSTEGGVGVVGRLAHPKR